MSFDNTDRSKLKNVEPLDKPWMGSGSTGQYIKNSWERCRDRYKISQNSHVELVSLTGTEIRESREPMERFLSDGTGLFDKIRTLSKHSGYTILITNAEGVAVKSFADSNVSHDLVEKGLRQGSLWSESIRGTNALGTCLIECSPVTVYAEEHYGTNLQNFSCSAAPLISPDGTPFGALDLSTFASGNRLIQALALNLVCETADEVEAFVFKDAYQNQRIVSLSVSPAISATTALVAVNDSDTIVAATTPVLLAMGCGDRYEVVGRKFRDIFNLGFEQLEASIAVVEHCIKMRGKSIKFYISLLQRTRQPIATFPLNKELPRGSHQSSTGIHSSLVSAAGKEPSLLKQADRCQRIVNKGMSILLQGETGTGKEVWARALHDSSDRADMPFVTLNCAAIPESLIESELFGYGAGTFTGGLKSGKIGKIQASDGGTLFLDEIGDMPLELQASLLRVLAECEVIPLGEVLPVQVKLNVICATHRDLKEYVGLGKFREDLYYRISGFKVNLPSLREREDKPVIIHKMLEIACKNDEDGVESVRISGGAMTILCQYYWPGNIRQLKNSIQYALCMRDGDIIEVDDLPDEILNNEALLKQSGNDGDSYLSVPPPSRVVSILGETVTELSEKEEIEAALEKHRWIVTRAAKALGVSRSTLHRKIKKHNLLIGD